MLYIIVSAFFLLFWLVGFYLLGSGLISLARGLQSRAWPSTAGSIVQCRFVEDFSGEDPIYRVDVTYTYRVDSTDYSSDRVAIGYAGSSVRPEHQLLYDKLQAATAVHVRYNPARPSQAVLAPGVHNTIWVTLTFGTIWMTFVIGITALGALSGGNRSSVADRVTVTTPTNLPAVERSR